MALQKMIGNKNLLHKENKARLRQCDQGKPWYSVESSEQQLTLGRETELLACLVYLEVAGRCVLGRNLNAYKVLVNASRSDLMHLLNSGMALLGRERRQGVL